ncbi:MAG: hypothetical protein JAZ02_01220 [Candidatus Thiodiazotropha endolucinida]|nr:hypothetical protein [Candidatus Thiodiazotropha endolucinida]
MDTQTSKSFRDQYSIRQGRITLYRRTSQGTAYQSDSWYAYFKIPGQKAIRRSLKTADKLEAESLAESQYFELVEKSKRGLSLTSKRFNHVANAYLRDYQTKAEREQGLPEHERQYRRYGNKNLIIGKYLVPYFKDKPIQDITDFDVESYKEWRKMYWISGEGAEQETITYIRDGHKITRPKRKSEQSQPHYSTVNKELTVLREVFEYARLNRMIEGREVPVIKNDRKPKNQNDRKPGLSATEVKHLLNTTAKRYYSESNPKHKRHLKLLIHYIAFMCLTGLRVSEAKNLKLSDCESITKGKNDYLKIFVRAKGKSRELIGLHESATTLDKLKFYHHENAAKHDWKYDDDMPVFVDQYGKPVGSFAKGLDRAFDDAGLLYDKHDVKRTAGAFRKYYITTALLSDVNYFELAKQCWTSVGVIERYYSEIETFHQPERFIFSHALAGVYKDA